MWDFQTGQVDSRSLMPVISLRGRKKDQQPAQFFVER
jgi:hypothetical protein